MSENVLGLIGTSPYAELLIIYLSNPCPPSSNTLPQVLYTRDFAFIPVHTPDIRMLNTIFAIR